MRLPHEFRVHFIGQAIRWGEFLKVLPFSWDNSRTRVKAADSKGHLWCSRAWLLIALSLPPALFLLLYLRWDTMSASRQILNATVAVFSVSYAENFLFIFMKRKQVPQMINTFLDYADTFDGTFSNRKMQNPEDLAFLSFVGSVIQLSKYVYLLVSCIGWVYMSACPDFVLFPDLSRIWSLFGFEMIQVKGVPIDGFFLSLAQFFVHALWMSTSLYFWLTTLILGVQVDEILIQMNQGIPPQNEFWTRDVLRYPRSFCNVSRHLQILLDILLEVTMPLLFVMPMNMVLAMVVWAYHGLSFEDSIIRLVSASFFLALAALFALVQRLPGKIAGRFTDNTNNFKMRQQPFWATKTVKAIRPPKFAVYGLFTVSNKLTFEGYKAVLDNLISLLAI